jgi:hypothetical protein
MIYASLSDPVDADLILFAHGGHMFYNIFFLVLVSLPLLFNCAGHRLAENNGQISPAHYLIPVYRTGFDVKEVKDGLLIEAFDADSCEIGRAHV